MVQNGKIKTNDYILHTQRLQQENDLKYQTVRVCYSEHRSLTIQNTGLQHTQKLSSG